MADLSTRAHVESLDVPVPGLVRSPDTWRTVLGQTISAVALDVFRSHKVAAAAIGIDDAEFGKWVSGDRRPHWDRLFATPALRAPLILALAQLDARLEVVTQIRSVERRRERA